MNKPNKPKSAKRMSDRAVQAKTGNTWPEWFAILDAAGAKKMDHKGIVAYLGEHYNIGEWWQQMVTVEYEQERGMREKHQKPTGHEISVSKTIAVSVATLYNAWLDQETLRRWLPEAPIGIRKATVNKSMRVTWIDCKTSLNVNFYPKGHKSLVVVQHTKLPEGKAAARMKTYWATTLESLKEILEA